MHRRPFVSLLGVLLLAALGSASAQDAYTARPMNVRAGPNREYPLVAQLDAGAPLDVHGCLDDWSWCDVSFDDSRGWIYAGGVSFVYQGDRVPLYSYGPRLGLPIVTFSLGVYWGQYYRSRPWYGQRDTWEHRAIPPHQRPSGRPGEGAAPMPRTRPGPMRTERRPAEQAPEARGEERGRATPPQHSEPSRHATPQERGAPPQRGEQRTPQGHAPSGPQHSGGRPNQGEHGNKEPQRRPPPGG